MNEDIKDIALGLLALLCILSPFLLLFILIVRKFVIYIGKTPEQRAADRAAKIRMRANEIARKRWGEINAAMVCPHCQTKGRVRTQMVIKEKGISGSKAAAGIFTGGISLVFTGLSNEVGMTQCHCDSCGNTWEF